MLPAVLPGLLRRVQVLQLRQGVRLRRRRLADTSGVLHRRRQLQAGLPALQRGGPGRCLHRYVIRPLIVLFAGTKVCDCFSSVLNCLCLSFTLTLLF